MRRGAPRRASSRSARAMRSIVSASRPYTTSSGAARSSSTSSAVSSARAVAWWFPALRPSLPARSGTPTPPRTRPAASTAAAAGRNAAVAPTQTAPAIEGDERRAEASQVETLQRVYVPDHASEEIAVPVALELCRRERLDALVDARADPRERSQREIVPPEPVKVASERPCDAEEAHSDDRHREGENRRLLRSSRDQVARGSHQADPEQDRERAEQDREQHAPGGKPRETEQPSDVAYHAASAPAVPTMRPASSRTTRSAC